MDDFLHDSSDDKNSDNLGSEENISLKKSLAGFSSQISGPTHHDPSAVGGSFGNGGGGVDGNSLIERRLDQLVQEINSMKMTLNKIEQNVAILLRK
jgi:hypothetical protein